MTKIEIKAELERIQAEMKAKGADIARLSEELEAIIYIIEETKEEEEEIDD